jgi:hypothetical protein
MVPVDFPIATTTVGIQTAKAFEIIRQRLPLAKRILLPGQTLGAYSKRSKFSSGIQVWQIILIFLLKK